MQSRSTLGQNNHLFSQVIKTHADTEEAHGAASAAELTGVDDIFKFSVIIFGCCCVITVLQLAFMGWLTVQHHMARHKYVTKAVSSSITVLRFPMAIISLAKFRELAQLKTHEVVRNANMITFLDNWENAVAFAQTHPILFISHQARLWST